LRKAGSIIIRNIIIRSIIRLIVVWIVWIILRVTWLIVLREAIVLWIVVIWGKVIVLRVVRRIINFVLIIIRVSIVHLIVVERDLRVRYCLQSCIRAHSFTALTFIGIGVIGIHLFCITLLIIISWLDLIFKWVTWVSLKVIMKVGQISNKKY